jgi:hypothetical protein
MKLLFIIFIFAFTSFKLLAQGPPFEIKYSEPLAVYVFVNELSSKKGDNTFKQLFLRSLYNRYKYTKLLAQFDTLMISYTYEFQEYPYSSKLPGMTEALLKKNLLSSTNLKEFKKKSVGIIPNANLLQLSTILYEFQLVYRELIYQPNKTKFEKQLIEITEYIKTKNIASFFDKGLSFYRSYWDESLPFEIAFYPLNSSQGFSAEAFCNNAVCALKIDYKDYAAIMGVVMHEIFHILYNEQSLAVKSKLATWFNSNSSNSRTYSYLLLNEVLATALGNGYVVETLIGKKDEADWYNRKYIDQMAKKIYPLVSEYVSQKKAIDEAFVSSYISLYEESFPEWLNEMDNLMCYRYVLSDNVSDFKLTNKLYPYSSLSQFEDVVNENSIDRMKPCALTKMIIISNDNETKLALVKNKFSELKDWKYKAKSDFFYHTLLRDKTQLIIINRVKGTTENALNGRVFLPQELTK